ncbi:MAG TPA: OmpA family protein [Polyangiaceae bacterium]|nr:OmpA family protein [Polyangiaceae bacterium]
MHSVLRRVSRVGMMVIPALLGLSLTQRAQAQSQFRAPAGNGDGADTHLFRPALDSKGFFTVNGSDIVGANDISFGLVLDYGKNLMRTVNGNDPVSGTGPAAPCDKGVCPGGIPAFDPATGLPNTGRGVDALVENSFQGTWSFNYGIENVAVVGITVPVVLMTGDEAYNIGPGAALYNTGTLNEQSISTVALHGKLRLTRLEKGFGLAVSAQAGSSIGNAKRNLGAEPGFWYWPQIIGEKAFGMSGRLKLGLNVGYRGHTGQNAAFAAGQLKSGAFEYGNLVTYGLGISWRAVAALDLIAETYGTYQAGGASDSDQKLSEEVVGGVKVFVERNSYLMAGAGRRTFSKGFEAADLRMFAGFVFEPSIGDRDGDGYKDDEDECPDDPEDFDDFKDEDGCPDPDNDNDGILDVNDRCPNTPEDRDGDEDEDGCPEGSDGDRDGDGILDSKDKCPDDPEDRDGFQDQDGCPDPDNDKDGILDVDDQCPLDPEDKDNFEDQDGCPEPDNDKDQILDVDDKCPNDPETYNGFEDEDGCPDKGKVVIEGNDILILEKVQFATNSAEILPASNPILDAVATTLQHHPEFLVVEVAGHADERSSDEYNLKLTADRAQSVVQALIVRGVHTRRLVSQGYGEYCPLENAHNETAWEKNRRVEFKVVKTEDGMTGVERGCDLARSKGVMPPVVNSSDLR